MRDLAVDVFLCLRQRFFNDAGAPLPFQLPPKGDTQDDPFDTLIAGIVQADVPGVGVAKAGPNTTPDLTVYRPEACAASTRASLMTDSTAILGIEVKKLDRTDAGLVARATGMDFNSTPPCGTARVYDAANLALDIRCFYLLVCQEPAPSAAGSYVLTALALCDGDVLNASFDLYLEVIAPRQKNRGLGSYGDGAMRSRPMMIFPNPLGSPQFDRQVTLLHSSGALQEERLIRVGDLHRTLPDGGTREFWVYRDVRDVKEVGVGGRFDPFPAPKRPTTGRRGKMRVPVRPK